MAMTDLKLPIFIPFTSDYGFKVTFGNEKDTLFLRRSIAALIQSPYPIVRVVFNKTTFEGLTKSSRSGIFDLACTDEQGNNFIVEMEVRAGSKFLQRMKFYAFQKYTEIVRKGHGVYDNLPKIYCIGILGKTINALPDYRNVISLRNQDGVEVDDQIKLITVELPKFKVKEKDVVLDVEKLIFTIKNLKKMVKEAKKPKFMQEDWIDSAVTELNTRAFTPAQYEAYMRHLVQQADAKKQEERKIARSKHLGKIEGKIERDTELVTQMILKRKMSVQEIKDLLGLDTAFIENIKSKLTI
jgi:predicted transposase/invertase (TIGR01784 family)